MIAFHARLGVSFDKIREGIRVDDYIVREENENTQVDGEKENNLQDRKTGGSSGEKGSTPQEVKVVKGYSRERTRHVCVSNNKILAYIHDDDISKYNYSLFVNLI